MPPMRRGHAARLGGGQNAQRGLPVCCAETKEAVLIDPVLEQVKRWAWGKQQGAQGNAVAERTRGGAHSPAPYSPPQVRGAGECAAPAPPTCAPRRLPGFAATCRHAQALTRAHAC
jgi:hypothetical protein